MACSPSERLESGRLPGCRGVFGPHCRPSAGNL